jgi:hypothetical protein
MKIKCPRCKSQLEVDAIGDFVACFHCSLEFTVDEPTVDEPKVEEPTVDELVVLADEPKPRKSIWFILTKFRWAKIKWFKLFVGGFSILVVTFVILISIVGWWLIRKQVLTLPDSPVDGVSYTNMLLNAVGGTGLVIFNLAVIAVLVLLLVNIILWIFLPLMVYSIKQSLEQAVREIKNLKNL